MHSLFKKRKLKLSFIFCFFLLNSYMSLIKHNIAQYYSRDKTPLSPSPNPMLCCSCAAFPNEHARCLGFSLLSPAPGCLTSELSDEWNLQQAPSTPPGAVWAPGNVSHWTISRMAVVNECSKELGQVTIPGQVRATEEAWGDTGKEQLSTVGGSVQAPRWQRGRSSLQSPWEVQHSPSGVVWRREVWEAVLHFLVWFSSGTQEQSHCVSPNPTEEKWGAVLMAAWWPIAGHMTGYFFAIFQFVALNVALNLLGKFKEDEQWNFCLQ